jgi:hypothetical protein
MVNVKMKGTQLMKQRMYICTLKENNIFQFIKWFIFINKVVFVRSCVTQGRCNVMNSVMCRDLSSSKHYCKICYKVHNIKKCSFLMKLLIRQSQGTHFAASGPSDICEFSVVYNNSINY